MTSTASLLFVNLTLNHDKLTFGSRIVDISCWGLSLEVRPPKSSSYVREVGE